MGANGLKQGLRRGGGFPLGLWISKKSLQRMCACNEKSRDEHSYGSTN